MSIDPKPVDKEPSKMMQFRRRMVSVLSLLRARVAAFLDYIRRRSHPARAKAKKYLGRIRSDRRLLSMQVAWLATLATLFIAVILFIKLDNETLERIGAYITGMGQLLVLIWIINTFYNQKLDIHEQYEQISLQRRALQEQTAMTISRVHREQIDTIARALVTQVAAPDIVAKLADRYLNAHMPEMFSQYLVDNEYLQNDLLQRLNSGDQQIIVLARRYLLRLSNFKKMLSSVDPSGALQSAVLSESPINSLGYILSLSQSTTSESDDAYTE